MLPAVESPIPENGARHIDRITNNNLPENQAAIDILKTELLCDESFSEIIKEEEEEVVGTSDASSTNCTVFVLNECKRLRSHSTDEEEEEDGNATEAVSDAIICIEFMKQNKGERSMMMDRMEIKNLNKMMKRVCLMVLLLRSWKF
ncbi:hypothetical protein HAX54_024351 [Datura stramonium]|uniref:Uncharacterized protein n=1 Tax=Datura stramonium TaxID=4076 RepID=A0ABS8S5Q5_DATST|nr:hypothetical protein [Datura stramonium]